MLQHNCKKTYWSVFDCFHLVTEGSDQVLYEKVAKSPSLCNETQKTDFLCLDCIQAFLRKMNKIQVVPLVRWSKRVFYERPQRMHRSGAGMNRLFWHFLPSAISTDVIPGFQLLPFWNPQTIPSSKWYQPQLCNFVWVYPVRARSVQRKNVTAAFWVALQG